MASTIKIKRSGVAAKTPTTADIATGELAINYKDQKLYSSNGTAVFQIGASSGSSGLVSITTATVKNLTQNDTVVTNVGVVAANDYLQVANAVATYQTKAVERAALANTNAYIATQATRITLVNTNLTGTNTALRTLISDRLQVANASTLYATKSNPTTSGLLAHTGRATISTNLAVSGNTSVVGLLANNSLGTAGYVLKTNGTNAYWDVAPTGGGGGGGATGGGTDKVFYENDIIITTNYTITTNKNAMTAGPVTINSGVTVTVPSGSVWSII